MNKIRFVFKGGEGSGHFGHAGRPGHVGGSAPGGGNENVAKINTRREEDDAYDDIVSIFMDDMTSRNKMPTNSGGFQSSFRRSYNNLMKTWKGNEDSFQVVKDVYYDLLDVVTYTPKEELSDAINNVLAHDPAYMILE